MTTEFKVDMNDGEHIYRKKYTRMVKNKELGNLGTEVENNGQKKIIKMEKRMEFQRDGDGMELKNILADLKMINDTESGLIILIMVLR